MAIISQNAMYLIASAVLNFSAQATAKKGVEGMTLELSAQSIVKLALNPWVILGVTLQIVGMIVWFKVLSTTRLSIALPSLMVLVCLFSGIFDTLVVGHQFSWTFLLGIVLAASSVYILTMGA